MYHSDIHRCIVLICNLGKILRLKVYRDFIILQLLFQWISNENENVILLISSETDALSYLVNCMIYSYIC